MMKDAIRDKITLGEPVFKKEVRHDQVREGYTHLRDKLNATRHLLV